MLLLVARACHSSIEGCHMATRLRQRAMLPPGDAPPMFYRLLFRRALQLLPLAIQFLYLRLCLSYRLLKFQGRFQRE